jgi:hypothetical protein
MFWGRRERAERLAQVPAGSVFEKRIDQARWRYRYSRGANRAAQRAGELGAGYSPPKSQPRAQAGATEAGPDAVSTLALRSERITRPTRRSVPITPTPRWIEPNTTRNLPTGSSNHCSLSGGLLAAVTLASVVGRAAHRAGCARGSPWLAGSNASDRPVRRVRTPRHALAGQDPPGRGASSAHIQR